MHTLHDNDARVRFTEAEKDRHQEQPRHKARGGSPLLRGARSPGRWAPACSCGWTNDSNGSRADAESSWRDHRRNAVLEDRAIAAGEPIYRVYVEHNVEPERTSAVREWRGYIGDEGLAEARVKAELDSSAYLRAYVEKLTRRLDGDSWERVR